MAPICPSSRPRYAELGVRIALALAPALAPVLAHGAEPAPSPQVNLSAPAARNSSLAVEQRGRYEEAKKLYDQGQVAEAIAMWEAIYRELHPAGAFRLAYNLGVAHLDLGDVTQAAERFETFLVEFEVREARRELTAEEVAELRPLAERTKTKLTELRMTRGRIQVNAPPVALVAKVGGMPPRISGFTAWVSPGTYNVVFGEGTTCAETKVVSVKAGELVEVTPTPPSPKVITKEFITHVVTKRPFSPVFIYVAGALTAVAMTTTIYGNVRYRAFENEKAARVDTSGDAAILSGASTARALGNGGLVSTIALSTITAGLAIYYFARSKDVRETKRLVPFVAPASGGATAGVSATF